MAMNNIALFFLVAVAIGGVVWVFVYPLLSGERRAEKRQETVARTGSAVPARSGRNQLKSRREQVEGTLKELDQRNAKAKSVPLSVKIAQAGLNWSKQRFFIISAALGLGGFLLSSSSMAGCRPRPGWASRWGSACRFGC